MTAGTISLALFRDMAGQPIGTSEWILIDQDRIDRFADVTIDHQFIHVDPEKAAQTPFGGTIAHGYLTLSLLSPMAFMVLPTIEGTRHQVNYGMDGLRFLSPVRSGRRIRGHFTLKAMTERASGQWQSTFGVSVEIEGEAKPALIADWITLTIL